jgi:hypothetical protein
LLAHLLTSSLLPVAVVQVGNLVAAVVLEDIALLLGLQAAEQVPNQNLVLHLVLHTR